MSARTRARYGQRIGPKLAADGARIWTRLLEGREFTFWATPNYLIIYATADGSTSRQLIRYSTKDNT